MFGYCLTDLLSFNNCIEGSELSNKCVFSTFNRGAIKNNISNHEYGTFKSCMIIKVSIKKSQIICIFIKKMHFFLINHWHEVIYWYFPSHKIYQGYPRRMRLNDDLKLWRYDDPNVKLRLMAQIKSLFDKERHIHA